MNLSKGLVDNTCGNLSWWAYIYGIFSYLIKLDRFCCQITILPITAQLLTPDDDDDDDDEDDDDDDDDDEDDEGEEDDSELLDDEAEEEESDDDDDNDDDEEEDDDESEDESAPGKMSTLNSNICDNYQLKERISGKKITTLSSFMGKMKTVW